jgi:hypothetical protein
MNANCWRTLPSRGRPVSNAAMISSYQSAITLAHNSRFPLK